MLSPLLYLTKFDRCSFGRYFIALRTPLLCLTKFDRCSFGRYFIALRTPLLCLTKFDRCSFGRYFIALRTPLLCLTKFDRCSFGRYFIALRTPLLCLTKFDRCSFGRFWIMKLSPLIPCLNLLFSDSAMVLPPRATQFVSLDEALRGFSLLLLDAVAITCCQYSGPFSFFLFHLSLNCWIPDLTVCGDVHSNPGPPTHRIPFNLNDAHPELPNKPTLRRNDINFIHPSNLRYANPHLVPLYQAHDYPDELHSLPKIVAIDIETYSEDDPQDLVTHDQLNSFRKNQADQRKDDEELQLSFINEQRVFLISCIFGFLGSMNNMPTVFVTSTHLIINKHGRMNRSVDHNRIKLDPFNVDTTSFLQESEILTKFKELMSTEKPLFITGHNISQFDLPVLSNRCAVFGINLAVHGSIPIYHNYLSPNWNHLAITNETFNCVVLDTFGFTKKMFGSRFGHSLKSLCKPLLGEEKFLLKPSHYHLTPMDFLAESNTAPNRIKVFNYCLRDAYLALKLCILFQLDDPVIDTFKSVRTTVCSVFRHVNVINKIKSLANKTQKLRMHTSYCVKLYVQSRFERNLSIPLLTDQIFQAVMSHLRFISHEHYKLLGLQHYRMKKPHGSISTDLKDFIYAEGVYTANDPYPGYKHLLNISAMPRFPAEGFARNAEYLSQKMTAQLETNIKTRYSQYIERYVNLFFNKLQIENEISDHFVNEGNDVIRKVKTLARFRLRQVKDLFLSHERNLLHMILNVYQRTREIRQYIEPISVKIILRHVFGNQFDESAANIGFNTADSMRIYNGIIFPYIDSHFRRFFTQFAFLNAIFPSSITNQRGQQVNVTELLPAVNSSPQSFLNASLLLSREIELLGGTPFNVLPLTTKNVPGFFTLDTRSLNLLISEVVEEQDEIDDEEGHQNELNVNKQVQKFSPDEQTNYWGQFIDLTTKPFKKKFHHFNNIIHTDGINLTIEFCRVDERGKPCIGKGDTGELKDNEFYFTAEHNSLIDERNVVTCDPGKRDLLYFCSKKPHQPIFVVEEENETKKIKDYEWLRLTYPEWTRVSRVHQKELLQCRQAFGIEEVESTLSQYRSNAATFNDFRNYVLEKTRVTETNDWFYQLDVWRIHKMQIFSHRQKVESKLKTSLIEKYATRAANGRVLKKPVIMIGDFSKQGGSSINLKHNPPSRGSGWRKTLRKLGFPVFLLNEWGTSSRCPECHQEVKKFLQVPNPKPYRREETPTTLCHGLLECISNQCKNGGERKYWNRNRLACINLLAVFNSITFGLERPNYLSINRE
ncbi:hypothetical protein RCL1_003607 [Eukaryota sp. TZLM3-RCL]